VSFLVLKKQDGNDQNAKLKTLKPYLKPISDVTAMVSTYSTQSVVLGCWRNMEVQHGGRVHGLHGRGHVAPNVDMKGSF